jgi:hypothetical protein
MNAILRDVVIILLTIGLTYFITIKVKFAKHEKTAMNQMKIFIWGLVVLLGSLWMMSSLAKELFSQEPLTRQSLFPILMDSFVLFFVFIVAFFLYTFNKVANEISKKI